MIRNFKDKETKTVFKGKFSAKMPQAIQKRCLRKPILLDNTESLIDLTVPPSNRLEKLQGNRAGQHSIRINDQYRLCFTFLDGDAYDVEITDYH
jgi:proteic killer suppression protein